MATKKEYVCISHAERMANPEYAELCKKRIFRLCDAVERTMSTEYVRDEMSGRVSVVNKVTSRKVSDRNKGLKVNDFAMESLQAIGAVDGLKFSTFNDGGIDNSLANIDKLLDAIDAADLAAKSVNNNEE